MMRCIQRLYWPLAPEHRTISQAFGENPAAYAAYGLAGHEGVDLSCIVGTPVYAAHYGRVAVMWAPASYGSYIELVGEGWMLTTYAHLSRMLRDGELVQAGDLIGYSGNTGRSTGPHLHFGACPMPRDWGNGFKGWTNPLPLLQEGEQMDAAGQQATALRFEMEVIERLQQEAEQHDNTAIAEKAMANRCRRQARQRLQKLISTKNGLAYRIEGMLGQPLPAGWDG